MHPESLFCVRVVLLDSDIPSVEPNHSWIDSFMLISLKSSVVQKIGDISKERAFLLLKMARELIWEASGDLLLVGPGEPLTLVGSERDREAELLQASDRPALGRLGGLFVGMSRSQFAIALLFLK